MSDDGTFELYFGWVIFGPAEIRLFGECNWKGLMREGIYGLLLLLTGGGCGLVVQVNQRLVVMRYFYF